jgi:phytol kinase
MGDQILLAIIFLIGFNLLLVFSELIYRRLRLKGEITRKFVHFTATLSTIPFPYLFDNIWVVLSLAVYFFVLLSLSHQRKQLRSIHDIDRPSIGTYLLPVALYLVFLLSLHYESKFFFILPILILAICDPIAGILGINLQNYNHQIKFFNRKLKKTWLGSGSFLVFSFIISIIALYFYRMVFDAKTFWLGLAIAVVSTLAELISWRGSDNLIIPLSVLLMLILFL